MGFFRWIGLTQGLRAGELQEATFCQVVTRLREKDIIISIREINFRIGCFIAESP